MDVGHVGVESGDEHGRTVVAGHAEDVPPAVALADPEERMMVVEPSDRVHHLDPRVRLIPEDRLHSSAAGIAQQEVVPVLQAIELLDGQRARIHPVEPRQVPLSRIAGGLHPHGPAAAGVNDADTDRRVRGAHLRIGDARNPRVQRISVVDDREDANTGAVELPVGEAPAVRAPAETVTYAELLLVHPVGRAVDGGL